MPGKLDQLDQIPGEPAFNTNAAWNKLSSRLENKPIHRKPVFFWAAAAIIILLCSIGLFKMYKPGGNELAGTPAKLEPTIILPSNPSNLKINDVKLKANSQQVYYPVRKPRKGHTVLKTRGKIIIPDSSSAIIKNKEVNITIQDPGLTITPNAVDTPVIAQSSPVRRLKVVHNNNLNSVIYKPEKSLSNISNFYSSSADQIRFSRNASDNIVQIKLSLTN